MLDRLRAWWNQRHMPASPPAMQLEDALHEREVLLDRKEAVLTAFRRAHAALTDRRKRNRGHQPERRGM